MCGTRHLTVMRRQTGSLLAGRQAGRGYVQSINSTQFLLSSSPLSASGTYTMAAIMCACLCVCSNAIPTLTLLSSTTMQIVALAFCHMTWIHVSQNQKMQWFLAKKQCVVYHLYMGCDKVAGNCSFISPIPTGKMSVMHLCPAALSPVPNAATLACTR